MLFILLVLALMVAISSLIRAKAQVAELEARNPAQDRESAQRLALANEELAALRAILDGIGEGLLAIDRRRRVVLANRRFAEMLGVSGDITGKPLGEAVRVHAVFSACDAALEGKESTERFSMQPGTTERRIEIRALPLPSDQIAAVALFIDVTQLERLEQIRRAFISDFSHEVRTPLAGLTSAVESFELGEHSPEDDRQLRRIMMRQLKRLQRLVDDLSELSHIEAGDLTLDIREVDIRKIIDDICEDFAERTRFNVTGESVVVSADALRMQQAFTNLIDNAIKYGGPDKPVDISVSHDGSDAIVRVTDHGEGIAPEEKERVFRRFYRVDKSRSQEISGSGLGLAITKHLVRLHRGVIDVESEPGKGATFIVRLPLAKS